MTTKPSPDAIKMLKSIQEYFEKAFKDEVYSPPFRREFYHLFKIDHASCYSLLGSNDAYIWGLGIIFCWDFDKNIENIVSLIKKNLNKRLNQIRCFENLIPIIEREKADGKIDDTFIDAFYKILEKTKIWKEGKEDRYTYLPIFFPNLKGNINSDFQIVKKEIYEKIKLEKVFDSRNVLYQQVSNWINSPLTKHQYGERHWKAMKNKFTLLGKTSFGLGELKDFEAAKQVISEVFYPDQEKYYEQLEIWAKNEIADKECSNWITSFLELGRTKPIRQVKVLRYKENIEGGKTFLLSKYDEKSNWDRKKKKEKEFRYSSLFDSFDENYNSFQQICPNFENRYSLFPLCICSNVKANDIPTLSMFNNWTDGIKIQHDSIYYNMLLEDLTLSYTNRYFYTYRSKYKNINKIYIIYSDKAFNLIKKYLTAILPNMSFNDNIVGCLTMLDFTSKHQAIEVTSLLSYSKEDYSPSPIIHAQYDNWHSCLASCGLQDILGYRIFANSAIYHITKVIDYPIHISLDKALSNTEFEKLQKAIERKINKLSFEEKYLCHFIDFKRYKFPTDQIDIFDLFRSSRRINLFHNVQHHYSTPVYQDNLIPFGKIVNQYKNYDFQKNTEKIGVSFYKYKDDKNMWLDKDNKLFLINLRILFYINWVYICNKTGNIKKLSTLWLYRILYKCQHDAYKNDKTFFSLLIVYSLIQNERIFYAIIEKIQEEEVYEISKYDSSTVFYNIIRYFSNNFRGYERGMSYAQLNFLNNGRKKHELLNKFHKNRADIIIDNKKVIEFAKELFEYIEKLLVNDKYPHSDILSMFIGMKPFEIPYNFRYESKRSNNIIEYNGDYSGTYAHDVMGYTNDDINTIFDGDPNAYWNID